MLTGFETDEDYSELAIAIAGFAGAMHFRVWHLSDIPLCDAKSAFAGKTDLDSCPAMSANDPSETLARIAQSYPARPLPLEADD
jgi:hypothetical protein